MPSGFLGHSVTIVVIVIGLLSGILSVVREIQIMYYPAKADDKKVFWAFVRIAFVVAAVLLWSDEHEKVVQLSRYAETSRGYIQISRYEFPPSFSVGTSYSLNVRLANKGSEPIYEFSRFINATILPFPDNTDSTKLDKEVRSQFLTFARDDYKTTRAAGARGQYLTIGDEVWNTITLQPPLTQPIVDGILKGTQRLYILVWATWKNNESEFDSCVWLQPPTSANSDPTTFVFHNCER
jgi:hypothetical protein